MIASWLRIWTAGIKSMALHPLRSALTVLGIFIGVASVIWLLAIGEGISIKAQQQIESLGANNIIVRSIKTTAGQQQSGGGMSVAAYGLTRDDYLRLIETIPAIERAVPIRELRREFRSQEPDAVDGRMVGCTPEYADLMRLEIERGHFLTDSELRETKNHCVLAAEVAQRLFPVDNPLGKSIQIQNDFYVVVGVLKPKNPTAGIGGSLAAQDFSSDVYVPITTLWELVGNLVMTGRVGSFEVELVELSQITFQIDRVENVRDTADVIDQTLKRNHEYDDYGVTVPLELLEQARTTRLMFIVFMGLIAAISLLVGGIGIMNIMLATVTERTREIGIRRALGAKRRDITRQFLAETISLSVVGGLTGIIGGLACGPVIRWARELLAAAFPQAFKNLPEVIQTVSPEIVPWSLPLAFGISVGVGVLFGIYPAIRAAHMDPIEALRHE